MSIRILCFSLFILLVGISCNDNTAVSDIDSKEVSLFELVPSSKSNIDFNNVMIEDFQFNHIRYDVVFQGAGVAVGDINNDGLTDIFLTSNRKPDKLYLNKGDMVFEDITESAGIIFDGKWSTGVTMADVNGDGFLDIYVNKYLLDKPENRSNNLYINNGNLTFTESAKQYGIADEGYGTISNFFDYDKDGDLDLYVGNQPPVSRLAKKTQAQMIDYRYTDRLYRNEGNGSFVDVTEAAGIKNYNFTLAVTVSDIDNDTWPDIYIACDFEEPDVFYKNNGDGTFTNVTEDALRHISTFSMGVDIADINNDGLMDIYVADMVAADNKRLKSNMSGMNPEKFWALANSGYHHQYMFNALQLNNGNGKFSEIGQMSGVSNTDWSWATLFADYDNDGLKDLVVTNGLMKDIKNNDYRIKRNRMLDSIANVIRAQGQQPQLNPMNFVDLAPSVKLHNYVFRNNGDLTFDDLTMKWGLEKPTWSHGAAYADFDNDGDLDLIVNNMNDIADLYENKAADLRLNNYLRIKLVGPEKNIESFGARAWIYHGDEMQVLEVSPTRGYFSRNEEILHFGLGKLDNIDKLVVRWLDGKSIELSNVKVNQLLTLNHSDAKGEIDYPSLASAKVFEEIPVSNIGIDFKHQENSFNDFDREILLPYKLSNLGPCVAKGDVNGDGLEDIFIGGASQQAAVLYLQNDSGQFILSTQNSFKNDALSEDTGANLFDADGDGDLDLYVVSGGNDFNAKDPALQDRLYINDGKGQFSKDKNALPQMYVSGSKVRAADYDGDGDLDLFVGSRQIPGKYGLVDRSFLLNNENGKFADATENDAPDLLEPGMVTDAAWSDIDKDGDQDIIVVGEWMPISIFINENGKLSNKTTEFGLANSSGWWNTIQASDIDNDNDQDFIIGNLGLNIKYKASEERPFKVYVKDFDESGTHDVYLAYYDSDGILYPVRGRQCSSQQLPYIKKEFKTYGEFSVAPVEEVLGSRKEGAIEKDAKIFESVYLENLNDKFEIHKLPNEAQISTVFSIIPDDWNGDGHMDLLLTGNYYEREVETTRSDASVGCLLIGNGKGEFKAIKSVESGLNAYKDVRDAIKINVNGEDLVLVANNNDSFQLFKKGIDQG